MQFKKSDFGTNFKWGVAMAAFQVEGALQEDGRGASIWDSFQYVKGKIKTGENAETACDFYHTYEHWAEVAKNLNFKDYGISLAWPRILPEGIGKINQKGIDHYHKVIDNLLEHGLDPLLTIYHWDLPQTLQNKGGWTNREILNWFSEYTDLVTRTYGDKVKNWKVLNEPSAFTGFGHMTGEHAPGKTGVHNFLPAAHHANLCQAEGGRIARINVKNGFIGTSFATFAIEPFDEQAINVNAARRTDATINRMFIEPLVGMGYPYKDFPAMKLIELFMKNGDDKRIQFDFDYIGIQYYCRLSMAFNLMPPLAFAAEVPATKRGVGINNMGFEIYPQGMYDVLKRYSAYPNVKKLMVTECGVCLDDIVLDGEVNDDTRVQFYRDYMGQMLRAMNEGVDVAGFYCWTLMDNFEWWEGYRARFGLVYVDHATQQTLLKKSGRWLRDFLKVVEKEDFAYPNH